MAADLPILAVEDEESDALLLRMAFKQAGLRNPLVLASDGQQAMDYLTGEPPYNDRSVHPLPALMLLDLKMPRMSGFDVLEWLAGRPELRQLPVVVLSSSSDASDVKKALQMGARNYHVKPNDFKELKRLLQEIVARWIGKNAESE